MSHVKVQLSESELREEYVRYVVEQARLTPVGTILADEDFRKVLKRKVTEEVNKKEDIIKYEVK
jgi:hypothetical protein